MYQVTVSLHSTKETKVSQCIYLAIAEPFLSFFLFFICLIESGDPNMPLDHPCALSYICVEEDLFTFKEVNDISFSSVF